MSWWVKQQIHTPMHLLSLVLVQIWQGKFQDNSNIIPHRQYLHLDHVLSLLIILTLLSKLPWLNEHSQAQGKVKYLFHKSQLPGNQSLVDEVHLLHQVAAILLALEEVLVTKVHQEEEDLTR